MSFLMRTPTFHGCTFNFVSGRRNPAAFVDKKSMGDRMMLSDYRFLEDGNRKIFSFQKEFTESTLFKPYPNSGRNTLFQQVFNI